MVWGVLLGASALSACGPTEPTAVDAPRRAVVVPMPAVAPAPESMQRVPAAQVLYVAAPTARTSARGRVTAIDPITQRPKSGNTGGVVGGVIGAVIGNQVGSGSGRAAATVAGGVGGALAGNKIERMRSETIVGYRVHVQQDNGRQRSFERPQLNGLEVGDRVRIEGNRLREI